MDQKDYCPECGAGKNEDGSFLMPKGWLVCGPCPTCKNRGLERMRALGRRTAIEHENAVLDSVFGKDKHE